MFPSVFPKRSHRTVDQVMTELRTPRIEGARRSPGGLRRVGACLVLALFVAIPCLAAHDARATQPPTPGASVSTSHGRARIPDVDRNVGHVPLFVSARPVRERHPGLDGLALVGFVIVFGVVRGRALLARGERLRFDALFAHRRGPPCLHHAI